MQQSLVSMLSDVEVLENVRVAQHHGATGMRHRDGALPLYLSECMRHGSVIHGNRCFQLRY